MVKSLTLLTLCAATLAAAAPAPAPATLAKRNTPDIDTVILNYALTLEHLENAFYRDALPSKAAFSKAGYKDSVYNRFVEIGGHEKSHVDFLTKALGKDATGECKYNFGVTGPASFIATAQLLEGVGVSAYLGAAKNITNPDYLTAAGSILTTEARHASWVQGVASKKDPFGAAYDTPLGFNQTFSLAAPLITSCPKTNPALPVTAFPAASFSPLPSKTGQTVVIKSDKLQSGQKVGFIGAVGAVSFANIGQGNKVTLPDDVKWGRTYAVLVKGDAQTITDDNTIAGPIAFDISVPSAEAAAFYSGK